MKEQISKIKSVSVALLGSVKSTHKMITNNKNKRLAIGTIDMARFIWNNKPSSESKSGSISSWYTNVEELILNSDYASALNEFSILEMAPALILLAQNKNPDLDAFFQRLIKRHDLARKTQRLASDSEILDANLKTQISEGVECYREKKYHAASNTLIPSIEGAISDFLIHAQRAHRTEDGLQKLDEDGNLLMTNKNSPRKYFGMHSKLEVATLHYDEERFAKLQTKFKEHNSVRHGEASQNPLSKASVALIQLYGILRFEKRLSSENTYEMEMDLIRDLVKEFREILTIVNTLSNYMNETKA